MAFPSTRDRNPYYRSFPFGWFGVGWADELAVGEVRPLRYFARDLVLWRDAAGAAHLMDAHCPHLGAHLGYGGRVEGCRLVCPFHGWEWEADGRLGRIPYATRLPPKARVATWTLVERNGLLLAWYHPTGLPPSFRVPEVPELTAGGWSPLEKHVWRIHTTWQETAENGPDYVHLQTVHGTPALPEVEAYTTEDHVARLRARVTYHSPRGDVEGRIDTDSYGPGFSVARFRGILDLCMVDWSVPVDDEVLEDHKGYRFALGDDPEAAERTGRAFIRELVRQMDQDVAIFDTKRFVERPLLVEEDGPILRFRRWAAQFTAPEPGARPAPERD